MTRWGILSTAKIGVTQAIPALIAAQGCEVTAIASRRIDRAMDVASQFGIPSACDTYEALLENDDVDAVYIPLPTSHHVEWTKKAAKAGKHVLCEKPVALKANEIDDLIGVRDAQNVIISEAMMAVYHPQWHKVRSLLQDGAIGALRHVSASFAYHNTDPDNIRNRIETGGGALPDIGCYPIATTRFATGAEAQRAVAQVHRDQSFGTDINVASLINFGEFDLLTHVATQMAWRQTATFLGENGYIELTAPFNAIPNVIDTVRLFRDARKDPEVFQFAGVDQYREQFETFSKAVEAKNASTILSLESSHRTQSIIDAIYASAEDGQWRDIN